jgi:tetratricopeptide (TPR) repeat protein
MRGFSRRPELLLLLGALALPACGKKPGSEAAAAGEAASGGEAKAGAADGAAAKAGETGKGNASAANRWGSPEADSGRPLPPRKELAGRAKSSYDDGVKLAAAGNVSGARSAFEAAVKDDAGAYQALYALGVLADREGKEAQAIDYYRRALRVQADHEASAKGIVVIYLRQGQPDKAVSFIKPLAEQWERNTALQAVCADTLVQVGRVDEAIQVARRALRRDERFVPAMMSLIKANQRAGKMELADSILEQAIAIDAKNPELHYYKGKRLIDDQRLAEALSEFRTAVELDPDFAEARMELGLRMLAGANYQEALSQFQAVERLTPKLVEVQLALGDAYRATKQWDKAKASFDKALRMRSDLPQAHFNLALMYMAAGAEFPGMDLIAALTKAKDEFGTYRGQMGSRLGRDDPSVGYMDDIDKAIAREQKRLEREKKAAERGARGAASGATPPPAPAGAPAAPATPAAPAAAPATPAAPAKPGATK